MDSDRVQRVYVDLRREAAAVGGLPITVRHVESILRMAEAHAKMHLRDTVNEDDVTVAIKMMVNSFISAQKASVMKAMKQVCEPVFSLQ